MQERSSAAESICQTKLLGGNPPVVLPLVEDRTVSRGTRDLVATLNSFWPVGTPISLLLVPVEPE